MTTRTVQTVASFSSPFLLPGFDTPQPAGDYRVDHDEESIDGLSQIAWHRVGSFLFLPSIGTPGSSQQMVPIQPSQLASLLEKDHPTP
ncbi:hypothetical protein [Methylobrevis pamukkalensis]|uniref:Uncharacterized protein n=1 Tax=Methylobrevis pamukkalensis TaxID=1439726 RepID=A0A1E3H651_9HYPH|nr:hypothetical protein [Methylobrevis pamukkalensis]ODN71793.1 hypothetical protein A6302_00832 [Methylobrevis pamukkalensis]